MWGLMLVLTFYNENFSYYEGIKTYPNKADAINNNTNIITTKDLKIVLKYDSLYKFFIIIIKYATKKISELMSIISS